MLGNRLLLSEVAKVFAQACVAGGRLRLRSCSAARRKNNRCRLNLSGPPVLPSQSTLLVEQREVSSGVAGAEPNLLRLRRFAILGHRHFDSVAYVARLRISKGVFLSISRLFLLSSLLLVSACSDGGSGRNSSATTSSTIVSPSTTAPPPTLPATPTTVGDSQPTTSHCYTVTTCTSSTTSTTGTTRPALRCGLTMRLGDAPDIGALQWVLDYRRSDADFLYTEAYDPSQLPYITAQHDAQASRPVSMSLIGLSGHDGRGVLGVCEFWTYAEPRLGQFQIEVVVALTTALLPIEPRPQIEIVDVTCYNGDASSGKDTGAQASLGAPTCPAHGLNIINRVCVTPRGTTVHPQRSSSSEAESSKSSAA